jgi:hypothetical protein
LDPFEYCGPQTVGIVRTEPHHHDILRKRGQRIAVPFWDTHDVWVPAGKSLDQGGT